MNFLLERARKSFKFSEILVSLLKPSQHCSVSSLRAVPTRKVYNAVVLVLLMTSQNVPSLIISLPNVSNIFCPYFVQYEPII
jgi:hypothetical protein